jgi:hypothetical protein
MAMNKAQPNHPRSKREPAAAPASAGARTAGAPKAPAAGDATPAKPQKTVRRREPGGRPDPDYVADLLAKSGDSTDDKDNRAFLDRPQSEDALAEGFGESFIQNATSGEDNDQELLDPDDPEGDGGPFVVTSAADEFALGTDESNPEDAEVEPFPTTQSNS